MHLICPIVSHIAYICASFNFIFILVNSLTSQCLKGISSYYIYLHLLRFC